VCDGTDAKYWWRVSGQRLLRCTGCGHGSIAELPPAGGWLTPVQNPIDAVSSREEEGQVETGRRVVAAIERFAVPGVLADVGCGTGSLLVAARERGWTPIGIERSEWASARARERGLDVRTAELEDAGLAPESLRALVLCDVLAHAVRPSEVLDIAGRLIEPGGVLYVTAPNAGSPVARILGRRWWSAVPMNVQYFTRPSLRRLLEGRGFKVRRVTSHPKVFTTTYYAERLATYSSSLSRMAATVLERFGVAEQLTAPNLHDHMAVSAIYMPQTETS
jgi:SAM-dependent methyltransferase